MNELEYRLKRFGNLPKNEIYEHLLDELVDNVLCYDTHNNYFTFQTSDPKTGQILMEAARMCGHNGTMDSYGHLKFMLSYGFLPLTEIDNKVKVDLQDPEIVIPLNVFDEPGVGYLEIMQESLKFLDVASSSLVFAAQKKKDLSRPLSLVTESYEQIRNSSKLPSHWFNESQYQLLVENKKSISEKMDRLITESNNEDLERNQKLLEVAMYEDTSFFELCQKIGKNLIQVVEKFAEKIAKNKNVTIDLSSVKYHFLKQEEVVKQFFESQYNESHSLIQDIKQKMKTEKEESSSLSQVFEWLQKKAE